VAARSRSFDRDLFVQGLRDASAGHAPSAVNSRACGLAVVQNRERIRRYSDRARALLLSEFAALRVGVPRAAFARMARSEPVILSWIR
jgi:hypothetical protein